MDAETKKVETALAAQECVIARLAQQRDVLNAEIDGRMAAVAGMRAALALARGEPATDRET